MQYLEFDLSEDTEGRCTLEAMASVTAPHWAALQAEVAAVLAWAYREFPPGPGALDDGAEWDCQLQASDDGGAELPVHFEPANGRLTVPGPPAGGARHTVVLTLCGTPTFAAAWAEAWDGDAAPPWGGRA